MPQDEVGQTEPIVVQVRVEKSKGVNHAGFDLVSEFFGGKAVPNDEGVYFLVD